MTYLDIEIPKEGLKLNIGSGGRRYEGWTGVDAIEREGADIVANMLSIPLPDRCANAIMGIHCVEHVHAWEVPVALAEWFRLLRPGGQLIIEMPDVIKCCKNLIEGRVKGGKHPKQLTYWGLFGDERTKDPYMSHKYGWTFDTIKPLLEEAGFIKIAERQTVFHPAGRQERDFRVEAIKPSHA